jgi:hypothetical protein
MTAAAHPAGVRVLARGHAVIAAISGVRSRGTTADPVRAFVGYTFSYYFRHLSAQNSLGRHQPIPTKVNACLVLPCRQERILEASPTAPSAQFMIRYRPNPNPLTRRLSRGGSNLAITLINPPPYQSAGVQIALRGGMSDGYQSFTLCLYSLNATSIHFASPQERRKIYVSTAIVDVA